MCACKDEINSSSTFTGHQGTAGAQTQYNPYLQLTENVSSHRTRRLLRGKKGKKKKSGTMNNRENHLIVSLCVHPAWALVFRFVLALPQDSPCVVICWQDTLVII